MRWINVLERRFGGLAVPGLMRIVVAFNTLVFLLLVAFPESEGKRGFLEVLEMRPDRIMHGEVWRLVSYIFIPLVNVQGTFSWFWVFFYLNLLWLMGEGLEQAWGSFKLNLFYVLGMVGTTVAAFFFNATDTTGIFLNMSLFFAFATLFPNFPILIFFVLPVPIKWIALFSLTGVTLQLIAGPDSARLAILVSLVNYILFFGPEWVRYLRARGRVAERQQQFQLAQGEEEDEALHHCKICGATEITAPEKEFRVSADGEEYCLAHLPSRQESLELPPPLPVGGKDEG